MREILSCVPSQEPARLHLYNGAVTRNLTVEQYHMVYPEWKGWALTQLRREVCNEFHAITEEEEWNAHKNAQPLLLPSKCLYHVNHMSGHHSKDNEQMHSPVKTMFGKIRDKYQAYCTMYKRHAMATCHRGRGCPLDRDINLHVEDSETTGLDNDNESTHGLDTTVALGGPEAEGHPSDPINSNQAKLMALMREINDLCQWVEAGKGQPGESLDCIEEELQNLSLSLHPPPSPIPMWPFREVICQYTDTLCTTQKKTSLTNWLLQDLAVYSEYSSTKLEEYLMDIVTAADLASKSHAKLAKAKSRGLTHTFIMEAINSEKSWDKIKDLLWLKLSNANIHTLCFKEIQ